MPSLVVLEAVMVSIIMMGAIVFVTTLDVPRPSDNVVIDQLNIRANDFLWTADAATQVKSCQGKTLLTDLVIKGVNGNHTRWNDRIRGFFGAGISTGLTLNNGYGSLLIHGRPVENGAGRSITMWPDFDFGRADAASPISDSGKLTTDVWGVRQGELIRMKGEAVEYKLDTNDILGRHSLHAWGATGLLADDRIDRERQGVSTIVWVTGSENSETLSATPDALDLAESKPQLFRLMLQPTSSGQNLSNHSIRAGVELTLTLPKGWAITQDPGEPWVPQTYNNDSGVQVRYRHNISTSGPSVVLFKATLPSNLTHPFDTLHARLGNGSFGESTLVVQYPEPVDRDLPRQGFGTTPYPLRAGEPAFFGLAFANGGSATTVTDVTISIPGGYDVWANRGQGAALFAAGAEFDNVGPAGGSWRVDQDGKHVRWHGSLVVPALGAAWWGADFPITTDISQATSMEPDRGNGPIARLRFPNGYDASSTSWGQSPGVLRVRAAPASGASEPNGYPAVGRTFESTIEGVRGALHAHGNYSTTPLGGAAGMDSAASNATFRVTNRLAPLGSIMRADADLRSLTTRLAALGAAATTIPMELWAPGGDGCSPTKTWSVESSSLPTADIADMKTWGTLPVGKSVYVASSDGFVSRLNPTTATAAWRSPVTAPKSIAFVGASEADPNAAVVIAGGESVSSLAPLTGTPTWTTCIAISQTCGSGLEGAALVATDGTSRIAATTTWGGLVMLDAADGRVVNTATSSTLTGNFTQIAFAPDGSLLALDTAAGVARLARFSAELAPIATLTDSRMVGFAPSGNQVFAGAAAEVWTLRLSDLTVVRTELTTAPVALVAAGDADGDGIGDAVFGLVGADLVIYFGSGNVAAFDPRLIAPASAKNVEWLFASVNDDFMEQCHGYGDIYVYTTPGSHKEQEYVDNASCTLAGADSSAPLSIEVGPDGILYGYQHRGRNLALLSPAGSLLWWQAYPPGKVASAHARGPWLAEPNAVLVAYADGILEARSPTTGTIFASQPVTDFVGTFSVYLGVPSGSFFGSHVLVADLAWLDNAAQMQHVRLADWYEVVNPDGTPVIAPAYAVELRVRDESYR